MDINKTREVEPLKDLDEVTYFEALKENKLDTYENEIALSEGALTIPKEILELPKQAQHMLSFYNDKDWINKETAKKSFNNIVESYIASLDDSSWVDEIFTRFDTYDKDGNIIGYGAIVNPEKKAQYMMLKQKAISYWNNNNLQQVVDVFKKLMLGGRKQEDLLKDSIIEDALYHEDDNYRLRSRNQAIKIMGMDKNVQMQGQDVWLKGGGREFGEHLAKTLGNIFQDNSGYVIGDDKDEE